ncbi:YbaN family protein [Halomonas chromatireducens]|uniref:Inner membrane protein n=1 Tax=Halomonas chromatireducens TaxID=507626 RepID=A0A0X8HDT2_9GAMM|nr:YbaN family protein [Halomonas chromatireducens]AMD00749.1 Inner membrane protein YbaN [Halomonas chromatireducens]
MTNMVSRFAWRSLAYGCIGLGAAGIVVPLLPTTPFLLVAAWAAPKGSPRLARWLWQHPRIGPTLTAWQEQRAIPRRAKRLAVVLLAFSWLVLLLGSAPPMVLALTALMFCCVATFVLTRPDAAPSHPAGLPALNTRVR